MTPEEREVIRQAIRSGYRTVAWSTDDRRPGDYAIYAFKYNPEGGAIGPELWACIGFNAKSEYGEFWIRRTIDGPDAKWTRLRETVIH